MKTDTVKHVFIVKADLDMEVVSNEYETVEYKIELTEDEWTDANEYDSLEEILSKKVQEKYLQEGDNRYDLLNDSVDVFIDTYEKDEEVFTISPMKVMELEGEQTLWELSITE